jgi:hypothetical protein
MVDHYRRESGVTCGFLVVLRFEELYAKFVGKLQNSRDWYAIPRVDKSASESPIKYRGTDRDALDANDVCPSSLADLHLADLEKQGRCIDGILFSSADVKAVLGWLEGESSRYEVIWMRETGTSGEPPAGFESIGFDPSYLVGDHFSASCDCLMFPRWHGTDQEGTLFLDHFRRLNRHGLYKTAEEATAFTDYYCSFSWTENERADYVMVEVFLGRDSLAA